MCGIVAFKGNKKLEEVVNSLQRLEYRGYDSSGIGYKCGGKIECLKSVGYVDALKEKVKLDESVNIAIGHTRWATHGGVSEKNSHPHLSSDGKFAIVHNGILENFQYLKEKYLRGVNFASETDSEVIAQLLSTNYRGDVWDAFKSTVCLLKGSFAIVMINEYDDSVYFARCGSPMIVGIDDNQYSISSDIGGLLCTDKISNLEDNAIGYIDNKPHLYDKNFRRLKLNFCKATKDISSISKGNYPHYMLKEILEIPGSLMAIEQWMNTHSLMLPGKIERVVMVSCGTSYHSSLIGKKYIEQIAQIPAECEIASEYIYNHHLIYDGTLGVFISQSGETADTISALKRAKKEGIFTLAITNVMGSTITAIADETIYLCAGSEICVASTKAYTSQVFALLKLSNILSNIRKGNYSIRSNLSCVVPEKTIDYLGIERGEYDKLFGLDISKMMCEIDGVVDMLENTHNILLIGKDYDYITVMEGGLKIKEVTYTFTDAYPCGELKHGTLSLIDNDSVVLALSTDKNLNSKVHNVIHEIVSRGGTVAGFGDLTDGENLNVVHIDSMHRYLMPIVSIIPFDILAYKLSVRRGINPDKPRNLAKSVTVE